MPRRNAFDRLRKDPQQPISTIPRAQDKKRDNRSWDQAHPVISYFIPVPLHEQAKDIRAVILALSQKHMTTISSVAIAFISFSLAHVRQGKLRIETRPNVARRKLTLTWEEVEDGQPQEIPQTSKQEKKNKAKNLYLGFRWGRDVDAQIKALAGESISPGEIVVFLLTYGINAHKTGRLRLKEETVVVAQKVSATW
jgi:hypothetical protein